MRQEPQGTSDFRLRSQGLCTLGTGESGLILGLGMELRFPSRCPREERPLVELYSEPGVFPDDARPSHCPFVLPSLVGWSSGRRPGIGFLSSGDREIGVLRNVKASTRPRLECRRETGLILRCDQKLGKPFQTKQGSRPSYRDQEGRRVEGDQTKWCRKNLVSSPGRPGCWGTWWGASKVPSTVSISKS